jgi:lysine 6-dehydrogenase
MERTTGWHVAIVAEMIARGEIPHGAIPVELVATGKRITDECKARGMIVTENIQLQKL